MSAGRRALEGRRVLVTRSPEQSAELVRALDLRGARSVVVPLVEFVGPSSWEIADRAIRDLATYDGVLFTSSNAVDRFHARLVARVADCDAPAIPGRVFAVGPATARALERCGIRVDAVASESHGSGLADAVAAASGELRGRRFLLPRSEEGREDAPEALRARGAVVDVAPVYRTVMPAEAPRALAAALDAGVDAAAFASPSAVTHAVEAAGVVRFARIAIVATGRTTAARAKELGLAVAAVARDPGAEALADAVEAALGGA